MAYTNDIIQEQFKAVIAITKISPPAGKGVSYRIDTQNGNTLWIHKSKLGLINEGQEYEVEGSINANWHNITKVKHLGPAPPPQPAPQPAPQPRKEAKKMDYWKPRDPDEQRQIFVCALLGREIDAMASIGHALMGESELVTRGQIHMAVWDRLFGDNDAARTTD